jgi:dihydroorotase
VTASAAPITRLTIRQPDDWHVHLRDGAMLSAVVNHTARQFARAIVMPNLKPPITTVAAGEAYRQRILAAVEPGLAFTPLITLYLTDDADPAEVTRGFTSGVFTAAKLYPANATTNSSHGVRSIARIRPVLEAMQRLGMPLLIHGEVTDRSVDIFDREAVFIETILIPLVRDFPGLKVVLEHITTAQAADYVAAAPATVAATITPHHLEINRNAMFDGGIRPHMYCLPVAKRESHRQALRRAVASGSPKFFLGTDSAPHPVGAKESSCGCAGIFCAPFALESYAKVFDELDALDRLEGFAAEHGPRFYGLPLNQGRIVLERSPVVVPESVSAADSQVMVFHGGGTIGWRFAGHQTDQ